MGYSEKIERAQKTSWIAKGFSDAEIKSIVELAQISAKIERRRLEMGMTQQQFAEFMGVTQGMVSRWESRNYNFTIKTLNDICQKIDLKLSISLERSNEKAEYPAQKWDSEVMGNKTKRTGWKLTYSGKEAIA